MMPDLSLRRIALGSDALGRMPGQLLEEKSILQAWREQCCRTLKEVLGPFQRPSK